MPIVEEKPDKPTAEEEQQSSEAEARPETDAEAEAEAAKLAEVEGEHVPEPVGAASPSQLGTRRFVYAAYFAGAIAIAFLLSKVLDFAWYRLQTWKPQIGEPRDEIIMPVSAIIGVAAAIYYWYRTRTRELAEQVANEMSKVTWPTRTEVTNGTFVVIVTTIISTVFFALMDRFWGFVTNLVYGGT
jgi:preprotein translocase subunit SecE